MYQRMILQGIQQQLITIPRTLVAREETGLKPRKNIHFTYTYLHKIWGLKGP